MSRGLGRVELAILKALEAEPDTAFTVDELWEHVFPDAEWIEKKHMVSIIRAAKKLVAEDIFGLDILTSERRGNPLILFWKYNLMSYAVARLKVRYPFAPREDLRARLLPGGEDHRLIVEGGKWWRDTQIRIAEHDGDLELLDKLKRERLEAELAAMREAQAIIRAFTSR